MFGDGLIRADCRRCKNPKLTERERAMIRAESGCEEDARRAVWTAPCPCGGDERCEVCNGSGLRSFRRCPGSMLEGNLDARRLATAYNQLNGRNVLPCEGGLFDQTAHFCDAVTLLDVERSHWDERQEEKRKRETKQP